MVIYIMNGRRVLTAKERAYILDKISNTSFYQDEFGALEPDKEQALIISIFQKLEVTYYIPPTQNVFEIKSFDVEKEAKKVLEDL